MKKLIYFILGAAFIGLVAYSPRLFAPSNGQVAVYTGASSTTGYNSLTFSPSGVAALSIGPNASGGNPLNMIDSVNAAYTAYALNHWNGTSAYAGFVGSNNLGHGADVIITAQNYTGAGDVAEYISNAAGGYWLNSQATPISMFSVGGVIPVKVTTTQMNAISSPVDGQTIYNTTTHDYWVYENGTWKEQTSSTSSSGASVVWQSSKKFDANNGAAKPVSDTALIQASDTNTRYRVIAFFEVYGGGTSSTQTDDLGLDLQNVSGGTIEGLPVRYTSVDISNANTVHLRVEADLIYSTQNSWEFDGQGHVQGINQKNPFSYGQWWDVSNNVVSTQQKVFWMFSQNTASSSKGIRMLSWTIEKLHQ